MTFGQGIFEELRKEYNNEDIIQRVSVTSSNSYISNVNGRCGGISVYKNPPHVLIQNDPQFKDGTFHSDFPNCIITFDLKIKARVSGIGLKMMTPDLCSTLQGFYLLGSNDGIHWKNITHEPGPFSWTHNVWNNFSFSPSVFQYYQIYQDPSKSDSRNSHYFHLSAAELFGSFVFNRPHSFIFTAFSKKSPFLFFFIITINC